ncbi:uncharacterized protein [Physcomitrium patens]|nr:serine/arginine-rich splicing factor RS2Z32-like isoform X2 [Physcomitrium patens]|eukprot:XP_024357964.1 serine/arginine-rich splicing factor RS2Z32-like isoform X2 [Physcomitrella patens]
MPCSIFLGPSTASANDPAISLMPRYHDRDRRERRSDRGGGYRSGDPYLSSNLYNRGGGGDAGLIDAGGTRLYIGRLSSRTRSQDLEDLFTKYGRVRDVDMKHNFAFVEFLDARDADDARHYTNGKDLDGSRLIVEFARRGPRGLGGAREYLGRGPPPGTGRCYNCGNEGHWARDCKAGDWRDKCYRCGKRGHIERNCRDSALANSSLSRSRSRSPRGHGKPHKCFSQSRSRSYSRSPARKDRMNPSKDPHKGSLHSKSRKLSPPPKETRSTSASPVGGGALSASQSHVAQGSLSPEPPQVDATPLLVQESKTQSLSRSPELMEKPDNTSKANSETISPAISEGD